MTQTVIPKPTYNKNLTKLSAISNKTSSQPVLSEVTIGSRIEHERFGKGVIIAITGDAADTRITVKFDNAGERVLLLKFAKFSLC